MDKAAFEKFLQSNSLNVIDGGKTDINSYSFIPIARLDSTANRLNSSWIRAQYIVLNEPQTPDEIKVDLDKWIQLSIHDDQYFLVQTTEGDWCIYDSKGIHLGGEDAIAKIIGANKKVNIQQGNSAAFTQYLRAMRTKPFLLLAGISGTGKSRIVKQMAFDSCPDNKRLRQDKTTPGNYCLVEVKPNWHDSSELMGYESQIGHPHYVATTFVRFLAKAMLFEDQQVPFFVCLDEMNLAPVEQYFAEFLSVLESRKVVDGKITSETLIPAEIFANPRYERQLKEDLFGLQVKKVSEEDGKQIYDGELADAELAVYNKLKEQGLRIPSNLIVIGTVNMDETTHQFSRKVIDRAMTIEMNLPEGEPFMDFFNNARDLEYTDNPTSHELFLPTLVKAADVVEELAAENTDKTEWLKKEVATILTALNEALNDTPFKIAYRVQNELMLYFHELWLEDKTARWRDILTQSVDQILMMKVLPRVEGDEDLLEAPLESLATFCTTGNYPNAAKKVEEMLKRLDRAHFTSYWP